MLNFFSFINKFYNKLGPVFIIWCRNTIYSAPVFETLIVLSLIFVKIILSNTLIFQDYVKYDTIFYDTGTMMSLLICLEHLFVCYYLIIILFMVYWSLYVFLLDFLGWSFKYNGLLNFVYNFFFEKLMNKIYILYFILYKNFLQIIFFIKEVEIITFLYYAHNFNEKNDIPYYFLGLLPLPFKKLYLKNINTLNIFINNFNHFDILGRSFLLINYSTLKFTLLLNSLTEFIYLLQQNINYNALTLKKKMSNFLFYNTANAYYFSNIEYINLYSNKSKNKLYYSNWVLNLRATYNDMFLVNQFKHSGIFEALWATFPTVIIICILIPSLILLYSFEDILNPQMTIKVIGNQWYWTYESNNFIPKLDDDTREFVSFAYDSRIIETSDLEFGTKRLLEVDNRLVLPVNTTIRFLVTASDVLHSFAMPELGFKVDATPGRLNQILVYISRPGVYYGQCSELCGANHAFMPIVIQAVTPKNYLKYISNIA
jgi:heme/copper-type cytochrome/quinol oxidase subunit 2